MRTLLLLIGVCVLGGCRTAEPAPMEISNYFDAKLNIANGHDTVTLTFLGIPESQAPLQVATFSCTVTRGNAQTETKKQHQATWRVNEQITLEFEPNRAVDKSTMIERVHLLGNALYNEQPVVFGVHFLYDQKAKD